MMHVVDFIVISSRNVAYKTW